MYSFHFLFCLGAWNGWSLLIPGGGGGGNVGSHISLLWGGGGGFPSFGLGVCILVSDERFGFYFFLFGLIRQMIDVIGSIHPSEGVLMVLNLDIYIP